MNHLRCSPLFLPLAHCIFFYQMYKFPTLAKLIHSLIPLYLWLIFCQIMSPLELISKHRFRILLYHVTIHFHKKKTLLALTWFVPYRFICRHSLYHNGRSQANKTHNLWENFLWEIPSIKFYQYEQEIDIIRSCCDSVCSVSAMSMCSSHRSN